MQLRISLLFCFALGLPTMSEAQIVHADDVVINGDGSNDQLCIGDNCSDTEAFLQNKVKLRIKDEDVALEFADINARDWIIDVNQGGENFRINDSTTGVAPFVIQGGAPENALVVNSFGSIGIGTTLPQESIHMVRPGLASIRMESGLGGDWLINVGNFGLFLSDRDAFVDVVQLFNGAPRNSLVIRSDGNVGLGTGTPTAPLELSRSESFNFFRISATGAAVNESVDITFTGGPLGTGQLRYNIVDGDAQEMSLDANGNMVLDGTLTTAGPTCAGGCDRVFDADYPLPSIAEHADQMFDLGHLPSIGATLPHAPVNLSERQGNIISALEHAHIYIAQQHDVIDQMQKTIEDLHAADTQRRAEQDALYATLSQMQVRLEQLEAR